jgi:LytR cell envelope-related transcriptional attenuator
VRRLPSSNVGSAQTGSAGSEPPPKKKRNPVYAVLAVAGVLVLGAAAAVGVPALVNGSKNDNKSSTTASTSKSEGKKKTARAVSPDKITVAVLNGTSIPGLAAQVGDRVDAEGFTLGTVSNASQTQGDRANSVAMYAPGHQSDARRVARRLDIRNIARVDSDTQQIAGDATVVVIVGTDKTQ